jgi:hypothetical protein
MFRILYLTYQAARFALSLVWKLVAPQWPQPASAAPERDPSTPSEESLRDGHELTDARPALVATMAVALFVMIIVVMAALSWMKSSLDANHEAAIPVQRSMESFKNGPHAMTSIEDDWQAIDTETRAHLTGYGWVDAAHSVAHIPIERAMSLIATQGLPARAASPPPFPPPDQEKLPLTDLETKTHATQYGTE